MPMIWSDEDPTDEVEYEEEEAQAEDLDGVLEDFDFRLDVAAHYQVLARGQLFGDSDSKAAEMVAKRIQGFIREELKVLLGVGTPKVEQVPVFHQEPQFTPDEVRALKQVAAKVLGGPAPMLSQLPPAPKAITMNTAPAPTQPQVRPANVKPEQKPAAKKITKKPKADKPAPANKRIKKEYVDPSTGETVTKDVTPQVSTPATVQMTAASYHAAMMASAMASADAAMNRMAVTTNGQGKIDG